MAAPDQAELRPLDQSQPNATWLNRLVYLLSGLAPGWLALIGYDGKKYDTDGSVLSTGNPSLYIKPAAGVKAILVESAAGVQILLIDEATGNVTVGGNVIWSSGTAFTVTLDHTATANRVITVPDATDTLALLARSQTFSGTETLSSAAPLIFTGTAARITGLFEHATRASRPFFQSSAANGDTNVNAMPSGANTISKFEAHNNSTPGSASVVASMEANGTEARLTAASAAGAAAALMLYVGSTKVVDASTAGVISLPVGQIAFPSTQNPSAGVNTLDDYEEGTWTPILVTPGATTYTLQAGTYTKIGNQVTVCCALIVNVKAAGASVASIGGLPFTVGSVPGTAAVNFWSGSATAYAFIGGLMAPGTTQVDFYGTTVAAANTGAVTFFQNGARIQFSGTYFV